MIEGKKIYKINDNLTVGIFDNGMHWGEIKDNNGIIESVITRNNSNELWKSLREMNLHILIK